MTEAESYDEVHREHVQRVGAVEHEVAAALRRVRGLTVRTTVGARKQPSPLTADDRASVQQACVAYALSDTVDYEPSAHARYLAQHAKLDAIVTAAGATSRQAALYASLCSALAACDGHAAVQAGLRKAYEHAFAAVVPRKQDAGDLVLDLVELLRHRRNDLPAGVRAQIAHHYAHAIDATKYPLGSNQSKQAERDVQVRRRRRREQGTASSGMRDRGVYVV